MMAAFDLGGYMWRIGDHFVAAIIIGAIALAWWRLVRSVVLFVW